MVMVEWGWGKGYSLKGRMKLSLWGSDNGLSKGPSLCIRRCCRGRAKELEVKAYKKGHLKRIAENCSLHKGQTQP